MNKKDKDKYIAIGALFISLVLVIIVFQSFWTTKQYINEKNTTKTESTENNAYSQIENTNVGIKSTENKTITLQQIIKEIIPTGTPSYGKEAGVSYDKVEESLVTLIKYHNTILLSDNEKQRYISIATTPETACEFCCGIGERGFGTNEGELACGCSHNIAISGLTKWLIKNTDYTNQKIIDEIHKWKVLFFPKEALKKELKKRNIQPESVNLPSIRGGC